MITHGFNYKNNLRSITQPNYDKCVLIIVEKI